MKRKIFIIEEYEEKKQAEVQQLIEKMVKEGDINLLLCLRYYHISLTASLLDSIADTIKAVGKEQEFIVDIALQTDQWERVKRLRKKLNQYAVRVELKVSDRLHVCEVAEVKKKLLLEKLIVTCEDYGSLRKAYHRWKTAGLSIGVEDYRLTDEEYVDFFEEWVHDPKAVWFEPFEDAFCSMLAGVPVGDCTHNSCMGKYLYLDREDRVYFCARKRKEAQMYALAEKPELLYNEKYDNVLQQAVEKRKQCAEACELFSLCRGGCPLEEKVSMNCDGYLKRVSRIGAFIEKEIKTAFTDVENPCMRQLYLSLSAYGFYTSY